MKIYHNARCRKSRETLQIIRDKGIEPEIIEYLKTPPSIKDLREISKLLGKKPEEFIRKKERLYKDKYKGKKLNNEEWFHIMHENPVLIERPIVIHNNKAVIGRPPENVLTIL